MFTTKLSKHQCYMKLTVVSFQL